MSQEQGTSTFDVSGISIDTPVRVSAPEFVDWHMILDQELSQLSTPETTVLGSTGFASVGIAASFLLQFSGAMHRIATNPIKLQNGDGIALIVFPSACVVAGLSLLLWGIRLRANSTLVGKIRKRPKFQRRDAPEQNA
jgi:hypothetical protein